MISVRLSPEEIEEIRQAAEERGLSVSAFLRGAALAITRGDVSAFSVVPGTTISSSTTQPSGVSWATEQIGGGPHPQDGTSFVLTTRIIEGPDLKQSA
jgi:hypothetical protein